MNEFLNNLTSSFSIYIIEQDNDLPFNRGLLLNIGFLELEKIKTNNEIYYYCFHNIDTYPINNSITKSYLYTDTIRNLYENGILIINANLFKTINGFPNNMWGWGSEDYCLNHRYKIKGITIENLNKNNCFHEDKNNNITNSSYNKFNSSIIMFNNTGLNNCIYNCEIIDNWIKIF